MTARPEYSSGVPCWADLTTTDLAAGREFYAALFGWEWAGLGPGADAPYWMASIDGERVAGLSSPAPDLVEPLHGWDVWISVTDVDDAAARAEANGASILLGPFDVPEHGRGAMIADPAAASFGLWQAGGHPGAGVTDRHGAVVWNELLTPSAGAALAFYGALFGWTSGTMEFPHGAEYTTLFQGIETVGGLAPPPEDTRPRWRVWFGSDDVAATVTRAADLGGRVVQDVADSPIGLFAHLADPAGAEFSVIATG